MSTVLDAAFNLIHDYPGGARALAPRIGKNPTSLCHEASATGTAKLGLADAVKVSTLTGDARILNAFADEMGFALIPLHAAAGADGGVERLGQLAQEFADVIRATGVALADGRVTPNELKRVEREWADLVACGQGLLAHLAQVHAEAKPKHLREVA